MFTAALVLVGLLQFLTMWRQARLMGSTLEKIRIQAEQMEHQTGILKDSVAAAQKGAEAAFAQIQMVKDKERARLRIEFDDLDLTPSSENGPYMGAFLVRYRLILDGSTQAYIHGGDCFAGIRVDGEKLKTRVERLYWMGMMIPDVITPEMRGVKGFTPLQEEGFVSMIDDSDERINLVREGKRHVYCEGWIVYRDVFGNEWEIGFQKSWSYFLASHDPSYRLRGRWQNYFGIGANPDANAEHPYPVQKPN